ncbi:hypothetical protein A2U01_0058641, partial [Trifolium medium]|nr:hypothetical protein [Trifolium medium]
MSSESSDLELRNTWLEDEVADYDKVARSVAIASMTKRKPQRKDFMVAEVVGSLRWLLVVAEVVG